MENTIWPYFPFCFLMFDLRNPIFGPAAKLEVTSLYNICSVRTLPAQLLGKKLVVRTTRRDVKLPAACCLLAASCWLLAAGCRLPAVAAVCRLLAAACGLLPAA